MSKPQHLPQAGVCNWPCLQPVADSAQIVHASWFCQLMLKSFKASASHAKIGLFGSVSPQASQGQECRLDETGPLFNGFLLSPNTDKACMAQLRYWTYHGLAVHDVPMKSRCHPWNVLLQSLFVPWRAALFDLLHAHLPAAWGLYVATHGNVKQCASRCSFLINVPWLPASVCEYTRCQ